MKLLLGLILILYCVATLFIFCYTLMQCHLAIAYIRRKKKARNSGSLPSPGFTQRVTVQLPVYNEPYVIERLVDAVCRLSYPRHLLEIQVLDDSTDETAAIADAAVAKWKSAGVDIKVIRRSSRQGFKAGALKHGLSLASGQYIAIFDADFLPAPDFLQQTIPQFADAGVAMVQTRWGHINRDDSILTQAQAFWLEAHFRIEQTSRCNLNLFFNFNGTAGVWRKDAILDAGNWQADTLTEDLDLSYRAQLRGWKFTYLEDVVSPAELPPTLHALKSQQFRWTKGGAEVGRKIIPALLTASLPFRVKMHGIGHLLNSGVFLAIAASALLSLPLLFLHEAVPVLEHVLTALSLCFANFLLLAVIYFLATKDSMKNKNIFHYLPRFQLYLSLAASMSFHNSRAVLLGYLRKSSPFIRTPKFNITQSGQESLQRFGIKTASPAFAFYIGMLIIFSCAFIFGLITFTYSFILFHLTMCIGFGMLVYYEWKAVVR